MAYTYGIPDGTYTGRPTTASCYEKDGRLILDVNFAVKDPNTGAWYKKDNGYDWEARKRFWLTSADGAFNEKTIEGLKEWAKGWNPRSFDDFYWFQSPDANGTPFGNLVAIGEVELNLQTDNQGNQTIWVHDPNRQKAGGRRAFVPDGATTDRAQMMAKWGTRAKALFAATPKKVSAPAAAPAAGTMVPQDGGVKPVPVSAPSRPAVAPQAPSRAPARAPAPAQAKSWEKFPSTVDGAFAYFSSLLGEPYQSAKHDDAWFKIYDEASEGKDPDEFTQEDVKRLFESIAEKMDDSAMPY